eukprot:COSAG01_NODE_1602_length_9759_cov_35.078157_6_plen_67_part_00
MAVGRRTGLDGLARYWTIIVSGDVAESQPSEQSYIETRPFPPCSAVSTVMHGEREDGQLVKLSSIY